MKYSCLRRVAQSTIDARAALALWPQRHPGLLRGLAYSPLPRGHGAMPAAIHAYRREICWSGFVDLAEWFGCTCPEMAGLAQHAANYPERIQSLFAASEQPLQMPLSELSYHSMRIRPCVASEVDERQCYLSVMTPQGRVWLASFPLGARPAGLSLSAAARTLPLALALRLGSSRASRRLIAGIRRGDVLLVGTEAFEVASAGKTIAGFSINEEGEISVQSLSANEEDADPGAAALEDIPVRLDFILQRRTMTVAQLDALYRGQVLQFDPEAEKQVEIMANGVRLARGELVELNGRLGVELSDITAGGGIAEAERIPYP